MNHLTHERDGLFELLRQATVEAEAFLSTLDTQPVGRQVPPIGPLGLPEAGLGTAAALAELRARYVPWLSGSAGPRYFGFVTGGATPAALVGDWLTSTYDQNVAGAGESSSVALTLDALAMVRELLGLPAEFGGAFVTGATQSNFVGLASARQWLGRARGVNVAERGVGAVGPVRVLSGTPHSSIYKALAMLGVGTDSVRRLPTLPDREAVDIAALAEALEETKRNAEGPAIVVANSGTVNTTDFDNLVAIVELRRRHPFWLHVDGAFGAIAAASPVYRPLLAGLDAADSVTVDLHKWLNVPYDAAVILTRHLALQGEVFRNAAPYLPLTVRPDTFVHLTPENSQRMRALPTWLTLAAYGRTGYAALVEETCRLARWIGDRIDRHPGCRLLAPVRLNGVCFTLTQTNTAEIDAFLQCLTAGGVTFLTPTRYGDIPAIRLSISNWRTTQEDIDATWRAIERALPR